MTILHDLGLVLIRRLPECRCGRQTDPRCRLPRENFSNGVSRSVVGPRPQDLEENVYFFDLRVSPLPRTSSSVTVDPHWNLRSTKEGLGLQEVDVSTTATTAVGPNETPDVLSCVHLLNRVLDRVLSTRCRLST